MKLLIAKLVELINISSPFSPLLLKNLSRLTIKYKGMFHVSEMCLKISYNILF